MAMAASSAMPYGTWRGASSSRIIGLTNRTLAITAPSRARTGDRRHLRLEPDRMHRPFVRIGVPTFRQIVGIEARQLEGRAQIPHEARPRPQPERAPRPGEELEGVGVAGAERIAHPPVGVRA